MRQTQVTQQLLLGLLQEKESFQQTLSHKIKQLEKRYIEQHNKSKSETILIELLEQIQLYIRYNGIWDASLDFYQFHLNNLKSEAMNTISHLSAEENVDTTTITTTKLQVTSSKKKQPQKKSEPRKNQITVETIHTFIDNWLAISDPTEGLNDESCATWIAKYHSYFLELEALCLFYTATSSDNDLIQAQWKRLPTRGTLFEYFEVHLFQGDVATIRILAPLMPEIQALSILYERFLLAIEQDEDLVKERIETAQVLYQCSATYQQILISKKYQLKTQHLGQNISIYNGVLIELFIRNKYDVFCMYVDQGLADETNLQLYLNNIPYHTLGALISLFCSRNQSSRYLEKILPLYSHVIWPHLPEVNMGLYTVDGEKLQKRKGFSRLLAPLILLLPPRT